MKQHNVKRKIRWSRVIFWLIIVELAVFYAGYEFRDSGHTIPSYEEVQEQFPEPEPLSKFRGNWWCIE